jgi:hypothetical protein
MAELFSRMVHCCQLEVLHNREFDSNKFDAIWNDFQAYLRIEYVGHACDIETIGEIYKEWRGYK